LPRITDLQQINYLIIDTWQAHQRFWIDLGQGNKMRIELSDPGDLSYFTNMDSLIRTFLHDISH
jgi:hypothetical protein